VELDHAGEIERGEHVAVTHDEAFVDTFGRESDPTRRSERDQLDRVAQSHIAESPIGEVLPKRLREIPHRQDDFVDTVSCEPGELSFEKRDVADRHERFGARVGQWAEASALAAHEKHRLHGAEVLGSAGGAAVVVASAFGVEVGAAAEGPGAAVVLDPAPETVVVAADGSVDESVVSIGSAESGGTVVTSVGLARFASPGTAPNASRSSSSETK
jgi:hypothetical protein